MCGRYASFLPAEALARIFGTVNPLPNIGPSWNLAPSQPSLAIRRHPGTGERHLDVDRHTNDSASDNIGSIRDRGGSDADGVKQR